MGCDESQENGSDTYLRGQGQTDEGSCKHGMSQSSLLHDPGHEVHRGHYEEGQIGVHCVKVAQLDVKHCQGCQQRCKNPHTSAVEACGQ